MRRPKRLARAAPADRAEAELQGILDRPVTYRRYVAPKMDATPPDTSNPVRAAHNDHPTEHAQSEAHA